MNIVPPRFIRKLFRNLIWSMDSIPNKKAIYLTFDDGPTEEVTDWVLDILDKYNAKATFFCIAKNIDINSNAYQRVLDRGHSVGNHTYSHLKGWETSYDEYINDIEMAQEFTKSNLFRPPYARFTPKQKQYIEKKYNIILWNVLSRDYSTIVSPKGCAETVLNNMKDGSIIVFHDSKKAFRNLSYTLPLVLEEAKKKGFSCEKIVLNDKQ